MTKREWTSWLDNGYNLTCTLLANRHTRQCWELLSMFFFLSRSIEDSKLFEQIYIKQNQPLQCGLGVGCLFVCLFVFEFRQRQYVLVRRQRKGQDGEVCVCVLCGVCGGVCVGCVCVWRWRKYVRGWYLTVCVIDLDFKRIRQAIFWTSVVSAKSVPDKRVTS